MRGFTESSGTISNREAIINSQERFLDDRVMHESDRLDSVRTNLIKQYSALDSYIQHYQQILI